MEIFVWTAHILFAVVLIVLVLLQHGKGADMGAAFGSGSAGSLFGASGSANFMSRATGITAALFFATSMGLTYLSANQPRNASVMSSIMDQVENVDSDTAEDEKKKSVSEGEKSAADGSEGSKAGQIPE